MTSIIVTVHSYKKAQGFKKDYVRKDGQFLRFQKDSGNHSSVKFTLEEGETFDARGSEYTVGATKWTASNCQSWAKFENREGTLVALNFDGKEIELPHWVRATQGELK